MSWNLKFNESDFKGFKKIPSFPKYVINKDAVVFSLITGKRKKSWVDTHGYKCFGFQSERSKTTIRRVHVILAEVFLGKRPKGYFVCHIDGNKTNNKMSNLIYATPKENTADMKRHNTAPIGERNGSSKLSNLDVKNIRKEFIRTSERISNSVELAMKYNVSKETINNIVNGRTRILSPENKAE